MSYFERTLFEALNNELDDFWLHWKDVENQPDSPEKMEELRKIDERFVRYHKEDLEELRESFVRAMNKCPDQEKFKKKLQESNKIYNLISWVLRELNKNRPENLPTWMLRHLVSKAEQQS
jgi:FMN phosphatase YigB (HAD superfamily)